MGRPFADHQTTRHSAYEFARGEVHSNGVESFFARLKRQMYGTHHAVSKRHLHRYVSEGAFKHNTRKMGSGPGRRSRVVRGGGSATRPQPPGESVRKVDSPGRYSPMLCTGSAKVPMIGKPEKELVSTSFVKRANLTHADGDAAVYPGDQRLLQEGREPRHAVSLDFMHYNFCRAHSALTKANPNHFPTTPAMAAGITDHVWKVEEILALMDPSTPLQSD